MTAWSGVERPKAMSIQYKPIPVWTDERVEILKAKWAEGLSCSQIARYIGGVTRSSVIGKLSRLGLSGSTASPRKTTQRSNPMPPILPQPVVVKNVEPITLDNGAHITVMTISDKHCRWPIGDPSERDFHFCGHGPKFGSPYCEAHARKAYQPQMTLGRRANG